MEITIAEILRGMKTGRLQSVGLMQVIPLVLKDENLKDERLVSPAGPDTQTQFGTSNYGSMEFSNPTEQVLLVPLHAGYVVKQAAQDHAMSTAGLVKKKSSRAFDTAMCIQETQGGLIKDGQHKMLILPYSLREAALDSMKVRGYSKLWDAIRRFNVDMGATSAGHGSHLEYFLKHYAHELDQFVAEFECVPNQCGAIILVNGYVVGIERAPSPEYWLSIWEALIRECYGSLAIKVRRDFKDEIPSPKTRVAIDADSINTIDDLEKALDEARAKEEETVKETIRKLLDDPFACTKEDEVNEFQITTVKHNQFAGQIVQDADRVCYASLFTTKAWAKNQPWREAEKFSL